MNCYTTVIRVPISMNPPRPISFIHQTTDGPVHLLVKPSKNGWDSLHWNSKGAAAWTFSSMVEANDNVLRYFQDIYNEHRCSAQCGPVATIDPHKSGDVWGIIRSRITTCGIPAWNR